MCIITLAPLHCTAINIRRKHLRSKIFNHDAVGDPLLFKPSLSIKMKSLTIFYWAMCIGHHMNRIYILCTIVFPAKYIAKFKPPPKNTLTAASPSGGMLMSVVFPGAGSVQKSRALSSEYHESEQRHKRVL